MFSPDQLAAVLLSDPSPETDRLDIQRYDDEDFLPELTRYQEQCVEVHRAPLTAFADALSFWLASINALDWNADYGVKSGTGLCLPMTEASYSAWIRDWLGGLPAFIGPQGHFRAAMAMRSEWNEQVSLCETDSEYFALYWLTRV